MNSKRKKKKTGGGGGRAGNLQTLQTLLLSCYYWLDGERNHRVLGSFYLNRAGDIGKTMDFVWACLSTVSISTLKIRPLNSPSRAEGIIGEVLQECFMGGWASQPPAQNSGSPQQLGNMLTPRTWSRCSKRCKLTTGYTVVPLSHGQLQTKLL